MKQCDANFLIVIFLIIIITCIALACAFCMSGCTISFNTVCSVGEANDVIDEEQTSSPDVKADVSLPINP